MKKIFYFTLISFFSFLFLSNIALAGDCGKDLKGTCRGKLISCSPGVEISDEGKCDDIKDWHCCASETTVNSSSTTSSYGLGEAVPEDLKKAGTSLPGLIGKVLKSALGFTGTIFFVLIIYAGLTWMMSAGNDETIAKAKKILTAAVIGLIIILSAYAITTFIGNNL